MLGVACYVLRDYSKWIFSFCHPESLTRDLFQRTLILAKKKSYYQKLLFPPVGLFEKLKSFYQTDSSPPWADRNDKAIRFFVISNWSYSFIPNGFFLQRYLFPDAELDFF
jgi:hypothetical protein